MKAEEKQSDISLSPWDPVRNLRAVDPQAARLSRGFLRCRPEKWFPGFGTQWMPLAHSLGVELKVRSVEPFIELPSDIDLSFCGTIDGEPLAMVFERASAHALLEVVTPGLVQGTSWVMESKPGNVMLEYLARRLLTSLALSWTGPEPSVVKFDTELRSRDVKALGAIRLSLSLNARETSVWFLLGRELVGRLDGLWRRQIQSSSRSAEQPAEVSFEVAQLAVPPSMLVEYTRSGTIVDLEVLMSDTVTLRQNGKPWVSSRVCLLGDQLGFETLAGPVVSPALPEGTTRLAIQFGRARFDAGQIAEMSQPGAIFESEFPVSDKVSLVINGQQVAEATLCCYEGRFAMNVA